MRLLHTKFVKKKERFYKKQMQENVFRFCSHEKELYSRSKKKKNIPIYFNTNYHTEMKLVPIIMDQCLFQFDALKFFCRLRLHGGVST